MTDRTPMEALLARPSQQRREAVIAVEPVEPSPPSLFADRYFRKSHPTSPRKHRHD